MFDKYKKDYLKRLISKANEKSEKNKGKIQELSEKIKSSS